jgi:hypothetical protein
MMVSSRSLHLSIKQFILFYTHSCMFKLRVKPVSIYSRISTVVRIITLFVSRKDKELSTPPPFFKHKFTALCVLFVVTAA